MGGPRECPAVRRENLREELAVTPGTVHVRDSKNVAGPQLALAPKAWTHFVGHASGL
ncbi:DUF397 domain-containing protein [Streptomyces sp. NK08204]|uniref:DUF397 domain-containing protein n=1 Tax=Streptomyces sp. NK08204 TaxID=2873260 RepID=UPI001CED4940|nr:DUF397 domain-containing protein [Streptomyces sp. NK08204]